MDSLPSPSRGLANPIHFSPPKKHSTSGIGNLLLASNSLKGKERAADQSLGGTHGEQQVLASYRHLLLASSCNHPL